MPTPVTAIFDIGKTNKKFLLFDREYNVLLSKKKCFEETLDDDGAPCEDLDQLTNWVGKILEEALNDDRFKVGKLNISTYGASLVHLDKHGNPVTPLYNYLKEYPEELLDQFYNRYGTRRQLALQTASPPMGMLNSGLQLFWLKNKKPELFKKIEYSLHLPQYFSYLFAGSYSSELTSIGCHTALWNFEQHTYHNWVKLEQLESLFPQIRSVSHTEDTTIHGHSLQVGTGIHDSSAALAPFIQVFDEPFMLLSTGTWSIAFNPFNHQPLTYEELEKDCLSYLNIEGKPVKAARYFLGGEYAHQKKKLDEYFGRDDDEDKIDLNPDLLHTIIEKYSARRKLVQEKANSSGPDPHPSKGEWDVTQFNSYTEGYYQLVYDLVAIQHKAIELAIGETEIRKIIVTGGFARNELFLKLLAITLEDMEIYTPSALNYTALGAAMMVRSAEGNAEIQKEMTRELMDLQHHKGFGSITERIEGLNGSKI